MTKLKWDREATGSILNSDYYFVCLNVHHADFKDPELKKTKFIRLDFITDKINPYFSFNHYYCQSKDFFMNVKCTRTDVDNYLQKNEELFNFHDRNTVEDLTLFEQNRSLYPDL